MEQQKSFLTTIAAKCMSPYHAARVNVSRNAFFSSRSDFFDVDIGKKQIEMWFIVVCTLIDNEYTSLLFF